MNPATITERDITALRTEGGLGQYFAGIITSAQTENARRRALVMRHPDLADRIAQLPGHAQWTGSVGGNPHTAAIVTEAEHRAQAGAAA